MLEDDEDEVLLSFMKKSGNNYVWPEPRDVATQPRADILCSVQPPTLKNERAQFMFSSADFNKVKELASVANGKNTIYFK